MASLLSIPQKTFQAIPLQELQNQAVPKVLKVTINRKLRITKNKDGTQHREVIPYSENLPQSSREIKDNQALLQKKYPIPFQKRIELLKQAIVDAFISPENDPELLSTYIQTLKYSEPSVAISLLQKLIPPEKENIQIDQKQIAPIVIVNNISTPNLMDTSQEKTITVQQ